MTHSSAIAGERQITLAEKNIDDLVWLSNNQIVFSSNRSGHPNLWVMPATGGDAIQITKGNGPDLGVRSSADGRTLLYLQQATIGTIWTANVDGQDVRQATHDDQYRIMPSLSPDRRRLAYVMVDNDPLSSKGQIYISDRDGSNRQQLTVGTEVVQWPAWSLDGKLIAYVAYPDTPKADPRIVLIDPASPGTPRQIGRGSMPRWMNADSLLVLYQSRAWLVFSNGAAQTPLSPDSIYALPLPSRGLTFFRDFHGGGSDWQIAHGSILEPTTYKRGKYVPLQGNPVLSHDGRFLYGMKDGSNQREELFRYSLLDGKVERVPGSFPGLGWQFSLSYDGQEFVYPELRLGAKLVIIEDLFR
jgi:hypothetical protein